MAPLLLGVSKQAIMRMDYNTKEVLEEFPMTSFKRWAANDKVFSIDFGKPDKNFYAQTTEGKKIKELVDGYMAIIKSSKKNLSSNY